MAEAKPLELSDRPKVMDYLRRYPPLISEHTFTNLYVWRYHGPVRLVELGGALVFLELRAGERMAIGPPVGPMEPQKLLDVLHEVGVRSCQRLPEQAAELWRQAGLRVMLDRDNSDYVHLRRDLAELKGRRYHRQKNLVNRCLAAYECSYVPITEDCLDELAEMVDRWFAERELADAQGLAHEYWAVREALDHFSEFGLCGCAVRIRKRMQAFTIGERLNENTAVVHFEKAMPGYDGLYQLINKWFCERSLTEFEFVNREQDLGILGLRKAKESYSPHHMLDKYTAWCEGEAPP
jgi:hypothetical protein